MLLLGIDASAFQTGLAAQVQYAQQQGALISQALTFAPTVGGTAAAAFAETGAAAQGMAQQVRTAYAEIADGSVATGTTIETLKSSYADLTVSVATLTTGLDGQIAAGAAAGESLAALAGVLEASLAPTAAEAEALKTLQLAEESAAKQAAVMMDELQAMSGVASGAAEATARFAESDQATVQASQAAAAAIALQIEQLDALAVAAGVTTDAQLATRNAAQLLAETEILDAQQAGLVAAANEVVATSLATADGAIISTTANLKLQAEANREAAIAANEVESSSVRLGGSALPLLALAAAYAGVKIIELGTNFEASLSKLEGFAGVSHSELAGISADILNLSRSTGESATKIAEALYYARSAGLSNADAMIVVASSTRLALAAQTDAKTVVDVTTSAINAYGVSAAATSHIQDVLTAATVAGKIQFKDLASTLGPVLSIAATAGINLEQLTASISTMTEKGISAQLAVTSVRQTIVALEAPTKQTRTELAALGLSVDEVRASIRDKGYLQTLTDLVAATGGNLDALKNLVPNIRALSGVLADTGQSWQDYSRVLTSVNDSYGASAHASQVYADTAQAAFGRFRQGVEADFILASNAVVNFVRTMDPAARDAVLAAAAIGAAFLVLPAIIGGVQTAISALVFANPILLGLAAAAAGLVFAYEKLSPEAKVATVEQDKLAASAQSVAAQFTAQAAAIEKANTVAAITHQKLADAVKAQDVVFHLASATLQSYTEHVDGYRQAVVLSANDYNKWLESLIKTDPVFKQLNQNYDEAKVGLTVLNTQLGVFDAQTQKHAKSIGVFVQEDYMLIASIEHTNALLGEHSSKAAADVDATQSLVDITQKHSKNLSEQSELVRELNSAVTAYGLSQTDWDAREALLAQKIAASHGVLKQEYQDQLDIDTAVKQLGPDVAAAAVAEEQAGIAAEHMAAAHKTLTADVDAAAKQMRTFQVDLASLGAQASGPLVAQFGAAAHGVASSLQAASTSAVESWRAASAQVYADDLALKTNLTDDARKVLEAKRTVDADIAASALGATNSAIEDEKAYLTAVAQAANESVRLHHEMYDAQVHASHLTVQEKGTDLGKWLLAEAATDQEILNLEKQLAVQRTLIDRAVTQALIADATARRDAIKGQIDDIGTDLRYQTVDIKANTAGIAALTGQLGGEATAVRDLTSAQDAKNTLDTVGLNLLKQIKDTSEVVTASQLAGLAEVTKAKREQAQADLAEAETARQTWEAEAAGYDPLTKLSRAYSAQQVSDDKAVYDQKKSLLDADVKDFDAALSAEGKAQALFDSQQQASAAAQVSYLKDINTATKEQTALFAGMATAASKDLEGWGSRIGLTTQQMVAAFQAADARVLADAKALTTDLSVEDRKRLEDQLKTDQAAADGARTAADEAVKAWQRAADEIAKANKLAADQSQRYYDGLETTIKDLAQNGIDFTASQQAQLDQLSGTILAAQGAEHGANAQLQADQANLLEATKTGNQGMIDSWQKAVDADNVRVDALTTGEDRAQKAYDQTRDRFIEDQRQMLAAEQDALHARASIFDDQEKLTKLTAQERQLGEAQYLQAAIATMQQITKLEYQFAATDDTVQKQILAVRIQSLKDYLAATNETIREIEVQAQDMANAAQAAVQSLTSVAAAATVSSRGNFATVTTGANQTAAAVTTVISPLQMLKNEAAAAFAELQAGASAAAAAVAVLQTAATDTAAAVSALQAEFQAPTTEELSVTQQIDALNVSLDQLALRGASSTDATVVSLTKQRTSLEVQLKLYSDQHKAITDQVAMQNDLASGVSKSTAQLAGMVSELVTLEGRQRDATAAVAAAKLTQDAMTAAVNRAKAAQDAMTLADNAATTGTTDLSKALEIAIADYTKLAAAATSANAAVAGTGGGGAAAASGTGGGTTPGAGSAGGTFGGGSGSFLGDVVSRLMASIGTLDAEIAARGSATAAQAAQLAALLPQLQAYTGGSSAYGGGSVLPLAPIGHLASYQHGGIVPTDQIAQVHAGELVLPKELVGQPQQGPQLPPALVAALREPRPSTSTSTVGPFNVTINVQGGGTPQETARAVRQEIAAWERDVFGRNAMLGATRG